MRLINNTMPMQHALKNSFSRNVKKIILKLLKNPYHFFLFTKASEFFVYLAVTKHTWFKT